MKFEITKNTIWTIYGYIIEIVIFVGIWITTNFGMAIIGLSLFHIAYLLEKFVYAILKDMKDNTKTTNGS